MTDDQIMASKGTLREWLHLARSDEREKLKAEIPSVGSGPWAIMQHWAGKRVRYGKAGIWEPNQHKTDCVWLSGSFLATDSGWSIVPGEPKPMTFTEDTVMWIDGTGLQCVYRGGKWYAC